MELRSALPAAVLVGSVLGAVITGRESATDRPNSERQTAAATEVVGVDELGAQFDLPVVVNGHVQRFVQRFTEGGRAEDMALYLKRSGRYEGMIRGKLRARGMPEDLFFLSMIESGFNPTARSHAKAVGLWQFMSGTGEDYGLRVDGYVDERRDPEKSTDAALKYLSYLHRRFGAWSLAAAAYNSGENRVGRVMKEETGSERGDEGDFWRIRHRLPQETRDYVPLIFAAALVGKQPERYGLDRVERWLPLETDTVQVPGGTDLATVAQATGATEKQLRALNPALVRGVTSPRDRVYPVRVPNGRADEFAASFERVRAEQLAIVERRAEAAREAAREKATREAATRAAARKAKLAKAAKQAKTRDRLARGSTRTRSGVRAGQQSVRVREGESLWTIARRHGTSVRKLQQANGLGSRSRIRPGQRLRVPA